MEKNSPYDKYVEKANTMVEQGKIIKFISTHVKKGKKSFKITQDLINDAKAYFKDYPEEAFSFLKDIGHVQLGRGHEREITSLKQFNFDNGIQSVSTYYYYEDQISGGVFYRPDDEKKSGIHQMEFNVDEDKKLIDIYGFSRDAYKTTENANIKFVDGKVDMDSSICKEAYVNNFAMVQDTVSKKQQKSLTK